MSYEVAKTQRVGLEPEPPNAIFISADVHSLLQPNEEAVRLRLTQALVFLVVAFSTRGVEAYVRTKNLAGDPISWERSVVEFQLRVASDDIHRDLFLGAARRVVQQLMPPRLDCTSLRLELHVADAGLTEIRADQINNIVVHRESWCRAGVERAGQCYSSAQVALTTIHTADNQANRIVDADIEFNGVDYAWRFADDSVLEPRSGKARRVLNFEAVLLHELGHALGFEHSCLSKRGPATLDDQGRPVPLCIEPISLWGNSFMAPYELGEVDAVGRPSDSDVRGICDTYPRRIGSREQARSSCACSLTTQPRLLSGVVVATCVVLVLARRRRFSRARPPSP